MPVIAAAGAIGSAVTGGAVAAGSVAASAIGGALVGAAAGAVVTAVKGGDIAKGAIIGAISGGVVGGVGAMATGASWLGTGAPSVTKGLISDVAEAEATPGLMESVSRSGNAMSGIEAAKAAAENTSPAMGQAAATSQPGLTFTQQALLEGVKGGATALMTADDDDTELEIAKMRYRPNEIPKMISQEKKPQETQKRQDISTPIQYTDDEMLDLKTMIAQITPQKPKGALSVSPGSLSVAVNDEVA